MDGFQKRTEEKRRAVLEAARRLFKQSPPSEVGVRDITAAAGVSTFTLYNYFESKQGLICEVVKRLAGEQVETLTRVAQSDEPFPSKMESILFEHKQLLSQLHPGFVHTMVSDPELRIYLAEKYQDRLLGLLTSVIDQGKEEGYVDPDLPNSLVIGLIQLLTNDINSNNSLLLSSHTASDISSTILEILIYGISGRQNW